jgi:hypothetical protein
MAARPAAAGAHARTHGPRPAFGRVRAQRRRSRRAPGRTGQPKSLFAPPGVRVITGACARTHGPRPALIVRVRTAAANAPVPAWRANSPALMASLAAAAAATAATAAAATATTAPVAAWGDRTADSGQSAADYPYEGHPAPCPQAGWLHPRRLPFALPTARIPHAPPTCRHRHARHRRRGRRRWALRPGRRREQRGCRCPHRGPGRRPCHPCTPPSTQPWRQLQDAQRVPEPT